MLVARSKAPKNKPKHFAIVLEETPSKILLSIDSPGKKGEVGLSCDPQEAFASGVGLGDPLVKPEGCGFLRKESMG